jgi:hypothetical protein
VAFDQVLSIEQVMENTILEELNNDAWTYSGGATKFRPTIAYRKMLGHQEVDPAFKWLWKSYCQPKHKVFYWLLLKDRLSTRNILKEKIWLWIHITVKSAPSLWKKLLIIYFGIVPLPSIVGEF